MHFVIVPRSSLEFPRLNGSAPGPPSVRYSKIGQLVFSKRAAEIFSPHTLVIAGYDNDEHALCITAVAAPPEGYTEAACYPLQWVKRSKDTEKVYGYCSMAVRRLLRRLGFESLVEQAPMDFEILSINAETKSIVVRIPATPEDADQKQDQAPTDLESSLRAARQEQSRANGEDHAAA